MEDDVSVHVQNQVEADSRRAELERLYREDCDSYRPERTFGILAAVVVFYIAAMVGVAVLI